MSPIYVGWDVGAWHCDDNPNSRDTVCVLSGDDPADLRVEWEFLWRGNLRSRILESVCPARALLGADSEEEVVVAIDIPLGWPVDFGYLLCGARPTESVPAAARDNSFLYRATERALFDLGFSPKSTVQDPLGSQSTKAIFFLQRFQVPLGEAGVWRRPRFTALETYPRPMIDRASEIKKRQVALYDRERFDQVLGATEGARDDGRDALYCALVAAEFHLHREGLRPPPPTLFDHVVREGWIWLPEDVLNAGAGSGAST